MNLASIRNNTSFREQSAWGSLVVFLAVFIPYFVYVFRLFAAGRLNAGSVLEAFIAVTAISVILQVALHIVIGILSALEEKDERDRAIELKSFRIAYGVLAVLAFISIGAIVILALPYGRLPDVPWLAPVFLSQIFLLCFVLAEVSKALTQAICYRRGV
jgi:hypothetical protein